MTNYELLVLKAFEWLGYKSLSKLRNGVSTITETTKANTNVMTKVPK